MTAQTLTLLSGVLLLLVFATAGWWVRRRDPVRPTGQEAADAEE